MTKIKVYIAYAWGGHEDEGLGPYPTLDKAMNASTIHDLEKRDGDTEFDWQQKYGTWTTGSWYGYRIEEWEMELAG